MFRSATPESRRERNRREDQQARHHEDHRRQVEDPPVGIGRHEVFLEQELHAVGDRLQQTVRADAIGTDARLQARRELPLEQRDVGDEAQQARRARRRPR